MGYRRTELLVKRFPSGISSTTHLPPLYLECSQYEILANMPETPRLLSLGMNGILSKLRQVEPGEAEQIPT